MWDEARFCATDGDGCGKKALGGIQADVASLAGVVASPFRVAVT